MYLTAEGTYWTAGMAAYVAVPVPAAETITLHSDDGETLAAAYQDPDSGRYTMTETITPDTLLYRSWEDCLTSQVPPALRNEAEAAITEGWAS